MIRCFYHKIEMIRVINFSKTLPRSLSRKQMAALVHAPLTSAANRHQLPRHISSSGTAGGWSQCLPGHLLTLTTRFSWVALLPQGISQNRTSHHVNYASHQTISSSLIINNSRLFGKYDVITVYYINNLGGRAV